MELVGKFMNFLDIISKLDITFPCHWLHDFSWLGNQGNANMYKEETQIILNQFHQNQIKIVNLLASYEVCANYNVNWARTNCRVFISFPLRPQNLLFYYPIGTSAREMAQLKVYICRKLFLKKFCSVCVFWKTIQIQLQLIRVFMFCGENFFINVKVP